MCHLPAGYHQHLDPQGLLSAMAENGAEKLETPQRRFASSVLQFRMARPHQAIALDPLNKGLQSGLCVAEGCLSSSLLFGQEGEGECSKNQLS